ncbi:hypothetical protein HYU93_03980 [Candidatus Daviesbacteria bacterium]|nr:hypothetical protein [Candidatus Daviesbacteria bacterium]
MILHVTELRNQIFKVFKMIDGGEEVTIIKKDSNKRYKIIPLEEGSKPDIETVAKRMGSIGIKTQSPGQMKKIFEKRYE